MARTGVDVLLAVENDAGEEVIIGGQRDATFNREKATIDATHKQAAGWAYNISGQGTWSIETDAVMLDNDESFDLLEEAFENGDPITIQWMNPNGRSYKGETLLTNQTLNAPMNDVMTQTLSFQGQGKYEKVDTPTGS